MIIQQIRFNEKSGKCELALIQPTDDGNMPVWIDSPAKAPEALWDAMSSLKRDWIDTLEGRAIINPKDLVVRGLKFTYGDGWIMKDAQVTVALILEKHHCWLEIPSPQKAVEPRKDRPKDQCWSQDAFEHFQAVLDAAEEFVSAEVGKLPQQMEITA